MTLNYIETSTKKHAQNQFSAFYDEVQHEYSYY